MQKLKPLYYRLADGKKKVNCYRINIAKKEIEQVGFDENTKIEIEVRDNEIVLKRSDQNDKG